MQIVAVINQKGGCGKTTTAINLSAALSLNKKRVLIVDLDPQAHATLGLNIESEKSIYDCLSSFVKPKLKLKEVILKVKDNFWIAPSSLLLTTLEQEMANDIGREGRLNSVLGEIDNYDYVILDCPPNLGILTINAIRSANQLIIPVEMSRFSFDGLDRLMRIIDLVKERLGHNIAFKILVTIFDSRLKYSFDMLHKLKKKFGDNVYTTLIHINVKLKEAVNAGKPVFDYDKYCRGSKDYFSLAREIISTHAVELENLQKEALELINKQISQFMQTEFKLFAPQAEEVYLAGDFNKWRPDRNSKLIRQDGGIWKKTIKLKPGRYRYRFVVDGKWQEDPDNPLSEKNPFGEIDSLLDLK